MIEENYIFEYSENVGRNSYLPQGGVLFLCDKIARLSGYFIR